MKATKKPGGGRAVESEASVMMHASLQHYKLSVVQQCSPEVGCICLLVVRFSKRGGAFQKIDIRNVGACLKPDAAKELTKQSTVGIT